MSIPFAEADGKNKPLLRRALLRSANQHDSLIFLLYPDNNNFFFFFCDKFSSDVYKQI